MAWWDWLLSWDALKLALRLIALIGMMSGAYHLYRQSRTSPALSVTAYVLIGALVLIALAGYGLIFFVLIQEFDSAVLVLLFAAVYLLAAGYAITKLGTRIVAAFPRT